MYRAISISDRSYLNQSSKVDNVIKLSHVLNVIIF